jgi:hypothetical protein
MPQQISRVYCRRCRFPCVGRVIRTKRKLFSAVVASVWLHSSELEDLGDRGTIHYQKYPPYQLATTDTLTRIHSVQRHFNADAALARMDVVRHQAQEPSGLRTGKTAKHLLAVTSLSLLDPNTHRVCSSALAVVTEYFP